MNNKWTPQGSVDDVLTSIGQTFKKGKVKRVFNDYQGFDPETIHLKANAPDGGINNCIAFYDVDDNTGYREESSVLKFAQPLLRGFSDSMVAGDTVLFISLQERNYFLGPINTHNLPSLSSDTAKYTRKKEAGIKSDGYPQSYTAIDIKPFVKIPSSLDNPYAKLKMDINSIISQKQYISDVTLEGRHNNVINLGSRDTRPYIVIRNNEHELKQKEGRDDANPRQIKFGSMLGMFSIGTLQQNIRYLNSLSFNQRLESYYVEKENPTWKPCFIVDENDTYGRIPETKSDERNYDQVVLFSDRITFDARRSNLNVSAHKDINIGVGENFNLNTIGFSVINSGNIYLGREAKRREQPMVLGEELRKVSMNIFMLLRDARALVQGVPIPLVTQDTTMLSDDINRIVNSFNLGTLPTPLFADPTAEPSSLEPVHKPNVNTEDSSNPIPQGDRISGTVPSFFSQHHFIESNNNQKRISE